MVNLKNKILGATGLIAAGLFFVCGVALAHMDISFLNNLSFRMPDAHMGRTVPFVVKGITLYLTSVEAALAKGLTVMTFVTLGVLVLSFWLTEQAVRKEEN